MSRADGSDQDKTLLFSDSRRRSQAESPERRALNLVGRDFGLQQKRRVSIGVTIFQQLSVGLLLNIHLL